MSYGPGGGVLTVLLHVIGSVFSLVAGAIAFLLVLALIVLLVRFLWFGTRAAQVYLAKNGESPRFTWPLSRIGGPEPRDAEAPVADEPDLTETRPYETPDAPGAPAAPKTPRKPKSPPSAS
ncbi:hypothetical protein [Herbiconiux sp. VKM Ac-2851]|uniref:hypothetical protein n=1 Tax=Herbiconiux sp. VKM Ac-2851 TaxID=2739025 RepID=UPI001564E06D|nr:hypothetical protein [Herbiconiux sp. VKM Ac-2851]NQX36835.1 hypothetical protein [Herbiconiux sp. VKM Ac-2851]